MACSSARTPKRIKCPPSPSCSCSRAPAASLQVFAAQNVSVPVLIEIEVGENRSGVIEEADFLTLLDTLRTCPHVIFGGIFSHDGNSYGAADLPALLALSEGAQRRTLRFAALAAAHGMP